MELFHLTSQETACGNKRLAMFSCETAAHLITRFIYLPSFTLIFPLANTLTFQGLDTSKEEIAKNGLRVCILETLN